MSDGSTREQVREFFEATINRRDWSVVERMIDPDTYVDHDGPEGRGGLAEARGRYEALLERLPDFRVDLEDVVVDGDLAVVRGIWSGTDVGTGVRTGFKAFVQLRIADGRIVERWSVATPMSAMAPDQGW